MRATDEGSAMSNNTWRALVGALDLEYVMSRMNPVLETVARDSS
jgi:hypothetical protein